MITKWQKAASFASLMHDGQFRKDGVTPYIAHPMRVALILENVFHIHDDVVITSALLHDTLEDTLADYDQIEREFGKDVADIVAALTKDKTLRNTEREAAYDEGLKKASWHAIVIKLADVYDNYSDTFTPEMKDRVRVKADRIISIAENNFFMVPHLIQPVTKLKELLEYGENPWTPAKS